MSNSDVSFAIEAKSDQLNAVDIMGVEPVIKITGVKVTKSEQPVSVSFSGDHGKPWKPSKGMLRILAGAWGRDSSLWVSKYVKVYFEPSVIYAGKEVGGIRIRSLSDIDKRGLNFSLTINRQKREPYPVPLLVVQAIEYPEESFIKALPVISKKMQEQEMTLQQVIAQCQKTGQLTESQIQRLEEVAPIEIDNSEDEDL